MSSNNFRKKADHDISIKIVAQYISNKKIVRALLCFALLCSSPHPPWLALLESRSLGCFPPFLTKWLFGMLFVIFFVNVCFRIIFASTSSFIRFFIPILPFPPQPTHSSMRQPIIQENESKRQLSFFRPPLSHPPPPNAFLLPFRV